MLISIDPYDLFDDENGIYDGEEGTYDEWFLILEQIFGKIGKTSHFTFHDNEMTKQLNLTLE